MTSKEFILWLKGFTEAVHDYNVTPKQWDIVKEKLAEVKDEPTVSFPTFTPNTAPIQTLPFIQPYNPYIVTCESGTTLTVSSGSSGTITTTPGQSSITYATPQYVTSTAYGYPTGSTVSYTNNTYVPSADMWNEHQARMAYYKPYQPYTTGGPDEVIKTEE
jgi:hypothetical protein